MLMMIAIKISGMEHIWHLIRMKNVFSTLTQKVKYTDLIIKRHRLMSGYRSTGLYLDLKAKSVMGAAEAVAEEFGGNVVIYNFRYKI